MSLVLSEWRDVAYALPAKKQGKRDKYTTTCHRHSDFIPSGFMVCASFVLEAHELLGGVVKRDHLHA